MGDAKDACNIVPKGKQKPKAKSIKDMSINGFSLSTKDKLVAESSAGVQRTGYQPLTEHDLRHHRAMCHSLPQGFVTAWNTALGAIGTKVARLLKEINFMMKNDPTAKAVVFSQFLGTLDVAGQEMATRGFNFTRVDGTMKQYQRADAIFSFTNDPNTRILLLSMKGKLLDTLFSPISTQPLTLNALCNNPFAS